MKPNPTWNKWAEWLGSEPKDGVASLGPVDASEGLAPYLHLLDRVLEDDQVTEAEADALRVTAQEWGLSMEDVVTAHHVYLESLVAAALQDGKVTSVERRHHLETATRDELLLRGCERVAPRRRNRDDAGTSATSRVVGKFGV